MTEKFVALRIRVSKSIERTVDGRDAGQGVLEYVGMVIVAAVIITAVFTAVKGTNMGQAVAAKITAVLGLN